MNTQQRPLEHPHRPELQRYIDSSSLEREVAMADIGSLHLDDLRRFHLEIKTLISCLTTQRENALTEENLAGNPADLAWLKRLQGKRHLAGAFDYACRQELAFRYQQLEAKKEQEKTKRHLQHQDRIKRFEFLKRRALFEILREQFGAEVIDGCLDRASAIAQAELSAEEAQQ